jgi:hypothetical protein
MKMHVMYDSGGRIVAAVRLDENTASKSRQFGRRLGGVRPVMKPGHACADLDVPAEHADLSFAEACRRLMVETKAKGPYLKLADVRRS